MKTPQNACVSFSDNLMMRIVVLFLTYGFLIVLISATFVLLFPYALVVLQLCFLGLIIDNILNNFFSWLLQSSHLEWNLDGLLEKIWEYLNLTRIYTKPKGMNPDYEDPVILSSKKRTVEDFCTRIHKDMLKQFK